MLEELFKEIQELKEYKSKYESQRKDKQSMSDELYKLMLEKYNNTSYVERKLEYQKSMCRDCRCYSGKYGIECPIEIPEDIGMPIPSDKAWIPYKKSCGNFEWD